MKLKIDIISTIPEFNLRFKEVSDFLLENNAPFEHQPKRIVLEAERYEYSLFILLIKQAEQLVGFAPFYIQVAPYYLQFSLYRFPVIKTRQLRCFGDSISLHPKINPHTLLAEVFLVLTQNHLKFDLILFDKMAMDDPIWDFLRDKLGQLNMKKYLLNNEPEKKYLINLQTTHSAWLCSLGRKARHRIKNLDNKFNREAGARAKFHCHESESDVPFFFDRLQELYPLSWKSNIYNRFRRNSSEQLLYFKEYAKNRWLRCYLLFIDKQPVAYAIAFQFKGRLWLNEIGFDNNYRHLGPGAILCHHVIKDAHACGKFNIIDFGFGENQIKRRYCDNISEHNSVLLTKRRILQMIINIQSYFDVAFKYIRIILIHLKVDKYIRKLVRNF